MLNSKLRTQFSCQNMTRGKNKVRIRCIDGVVVVEEEVKIFPCKTFDFWQLKRLASFPITCLEIPHTPKHCRGTSENKKRREKTAKMASRKFKFTLSTTQRMQRYGFTNALCALKCSGILGRGASTLANANERTLEISRRLYSRCPIITLGILK